MPQEQLSFGEIAVGLVAVAIGIVVLIVVLAWQFILPVIGLLYLLSWLK